MSSGPYAVVEFEGDSTCVVPIKWLFRENGQLYSYWCDSKRRIEKLEIANPNWPIWAIIRVVARAATFVEADRICSSFSVTSAIEDADLPCLSDIEERSVFLLKSSDQSRGSRKATKRKPVDMFAASSSDSDEHDELSPQQKRRTKGSRLLQTLKSKRLHIEDHLPYPPPLKSSSGHLSPSDSASAICEDSVDSPDLFSTFGSTTVKRRLQNQQSTEHDKSSGNKVVLENNRSAGKSSVLSESIEQFGSPKGNDNNLVADMRSQCTFNESRLYETSTPSSSEAGLGGSSEGQANHTHESRVRETSTPSSSETGLGGSSEGRAVRTHESRVRETSTPSSSETGLGGSSEGQAIRTHESRVRETSTPSSSETGLGGSSEGQAIRTRESRVHETSTPRSCDNGLGGSSEGRASRTHESRVRETSTPSSSESGPRRSSEGQAIHTHRSRVDRTSTSTTSSDSGLLRSTITTPSNRTLTISADTGVISDILLRILHVTEQNRTLITETKADLERVKQHVLLLRNAADTSANLEADVIELLQEPFDSVADLEEFCSQLQEDRIFRKKVVKLLSAQGGKDVGDRTRIIMYKLLTNKLMTEFNLEGRGQKQKKAIKDMPQLGSVIFDSVRHDWSGKAEPKEVREAIGECLKHATQRYTREISRQQKQRSVSDVCGIGDVGEQ